MAEFLTNTLRARIFQFGAAFFCAAVLVTNVDVKSIIVGNEPPMPTQTSLPPIHITTTKPSSTPLIWSTDPVKVPDYEPTTFSLDSSAVKTIYVFDYILDQPAIETPHPEASAKAPQLPFETVWNPKGSSGDASALPRPPRIVEHSTTNGDSNDKSYSTNESPKNSSWILKSIQGVFIEVKEHILTIFPGMAPTFAMIAWYQFRYMQYLRGIPTAEYFKFMALKLASHTTARDREVNHMRTFLHTWQNDMTEAVEKLEAAVAARQFSDQKAAYKIARLQSLIVEKQNALAREQQTSKLFTEKAARDKSRLDSSLKEKDDTIATMGVEAQKLRKEIKDLTTEVKKLEDDRDEALKNRSEAEAADKATITQLNGQVEEANKKCKAAETHASRQESVVMEAREQLKAAEERALQAENRSAEAVKLAEASEEKISQKQSTIDFLTNTIATNSTAFIEAATKANEAKENAEKTEKALREQIAEMVEQHKEKAAQSTARNKTLQQELNSEKEERLRLISSNEDQRVKEAEEGRMRAEEAARRAKGEANHVVKTQAGQLNKAKAMNDAYRARYGSLDGSNSANGSATTASTASASLSAPNVSQNSNDQSPIDEASRTLNQPSAIVDPVSSESGAAWCARPQAQDGALNTSSTVNGRLDTCPNPGLSFDPNASGTQRIPGHKKRRRRAARSSKNTCQPGEGLLANTPTVPEELQEAETGVWAEDW